MSYYEKDFFAALHYAANDRWIIVFTPRFGHTLQSGAGDLNCPPASRVTAGAVGFEEVPEQVGVQRHIFMCNSERSEESFYF